MILCWFVGRFQHIIGCYWVKETARRQIPAMSEILPYLCRRPSRWGGLQLRMCWGHSQGMLSCESQGTSPCNSAWTYHQLFKLPNWNGAISWWAMSPTGKTNGPQTSPNLTIFYPNLSNSNSGIKRRPLTLLKKTTQGCGTRHLPRLHHLWLQDLHHWGSGHLCCVLLWLSPHLRGQVWECQHDATRPHSHQQRELCSHNWWINWPESGCKDL